MSILQILDFLHSMNEVKFEGPTSRVRIRLITEVYDCPPHISKRRWDIMEAIGAPVALTNFLYSNGCTNVVHCQSIAKNGKVVTDVAGIVPIGSDLSRAITMMEAKKERQVNQYE